MTGLRTTLTLVSKDLRIQARTAPESARSVLLALMIVVVMGLALGPGRGAPLGSAGVTLVIWIGLLFGGVLCFERSMSAERAGEPINALRLCPLSPGVLYWSKVLGNIISLGSVTLVVLAAGIALLSLDLSAAPLGAAVLITQSLIGVAALGTLMSAAAPGDGTGGGLVGLLVLPVALPLMLTSAQAMRGVLDSGEAWTVGAGLLGAMDVLYLGVSRLVFGLLLEE